MNWIPISERLPDDNEKVFAYTEWKYSNKPELIHSFVVGHYEKRLDGWLGQNGFIWDIPINYIHGCDRGVKVTHWQPLPPPPENE